jgi:hypothetical protein
MFERCIARTKLKLIRAKETADATAQLLFQLERVFFYAFGQDISKTMYTQLKASQNRFIAIQ